MAASTLTPDARLFLNVLAVLVGIGGLSLLWVATQSIGTALFGLSFCALWFWYYQLANHS
jgi:hypothetical protein